MQESDLWFLVSGVPPQADQVSAAKKFQMTNHKFQINHNDRNSKSQVLNIEHWILEFGIYLLFGYCNLVLYNFGAWNFDRNSTLLNN